MDEVVKEVVEEQQQEDISAKINELEKEKNRIAADARRTVEKQKKEYDATAQSLGFGSHSEGHGQTEPGRNFSIYPNYHRSGLSVQAC